MRIKLSDGSCKHKANFRDFQKPCIAALEIIVRLEKKMDEDSTVFLLKSPLPSVISAHHEVEPIHLHCKATSFVLRWPDWIWQ